MENELKEKEVRKTLTVREIMEKVILKYGKESVSQFFMITPESEEE